MGSLSQSSGYNTNPESGIKDYRLGCGKTAAHPRHASCFEHLGERMETDLPVTGQEACLFLSTGLVHRHSWPLIPSSTESGKGCSNLKRAALLSFPCEQRPGLEKLVEVRKARAPSEQQNPSLPRPLFPSSADTLTPWGQGAQKLALVLSQP